MLNFYLIRISGFYYEPYIRWNPTPRTTLGEMLITNIIYFSSLASQFYIFSDKAIEWPKFIFQLWCENVFSCHYLWNIWKGKKSIFLVYFNKITKTIFSIQGQGGGLNNRLNNWKQLISYFTIKIEAENFFIIFIIC